MLRAVASLFLILSSSLSIAQTPPPVIGKAYIVADVSSGQILASEKADERFEPASLTKIMTCLLYTSPSPRDRTRSRMPSSA